MFTPSKSLSDCFSVFMNVVSKVHTNRKVGHLILIKWNHQLKIKQKPGRFTSVFSFTDSTVVICRPIKGHVLSVKCSMSLHMTDKLRIQV